MNLAIQSIGSSSSGNSYLITDGTTHLLLDVGLSGKNIRAALADANISEDAVSGILVTHEHVDHVKSIRMMSRICENAEVIASRGCPFTCSYCCCVNLRRLLPKGIHGVRTRSVKSVIDELVEAKKDYKAGDTITLTVDRSGEKLTLTLTFDEDTPERQAAQQKQLEQQEQQQKQQQQLQVQ